MLLRPIAPCAGQIQGQQPAQDVIVGHRGRPVGLPSHRLRHQLLDTASIEVQDAPAVGKAIQRYAEGDVDLHDCLIVSLAADRKAEVVTFDARAAKRLGMQLLR